MSRARSVLRLWKLPRLSVRSAAGWATNPPCLDSPCLDSAMPWSAVGSGVMVATTKAEGGGATAAEVTPVGSAIARTPATAKFRQSHCRAGLALRLSDSPRRPESAATLAGLHPHGLAAIPIRHVPPRPLTSTEARSCWQRRSRLCERVSTSTHATTPGLPRAGTSNGDCCRGRRDRTVVPRGRYLFRFAQAVLSCVERSRLDRRQRGAHDQTGGNGRYKLAHSVRHSGLQLLATTAPATFLTFGFGMWLVSGSSTRAVDKRLWLCA